MKISLLNENKKPLRNRVEVFATKNGKVYGGFYEDGSFGVFGGGLDGEAVADAASREFEEESGYKINNLNSLDLKPLEVEWDDQGGKKDDRKEKYRGTRTWMYVGELDDDGDKDKATGEDGQHHLKNVGLKDVDDAIESIENNLNSNETIKKQQNLRIKALRKIKNNI